MKIRTIGIFATIIIAFNFIGAEEITLSPESFDTTTVLEVSKTSLEFSLPQSTSSGITITGADHCILSVPVSYSITISSIIRDTLIPPIIKGKLVLSKDISSPSLSEVSPSIIDIIGLLNTSGDTLVFNITEVANTWYKDEWDNFEVKIELPKIMKVSTGKIKLIPKLD